MADSKATNVIENNKQAINGRQSVCFPTDIGNYFMSINFYEYRGVGIGGAGYNLGSSGSSTSPNSTLTPLQKIYNADKTSINNQIKQNSFASIKLPIPANLKDSFDINYENGVQLGGLIGALGDISGQVVNLSKGIGKDGLNSKLLSGNGAGGQAAGETGLAIGKLAVKYLQDSGLSLGQNISGLYDLTTGSAVNPNIAVLFKGPTLKTHSFSWMIAPRNKGESDAIKKIIAIVKRAMHPTRLQGGTSAILSFPCECLIEFVGVRQDTTFLYPMRPTVVESISVNYAPENVPSFFQQTDEPTALELTMHFQETSYYTRDSFDDTSQYGSDGFNARNDNLAIGELASGFSPPFGTTPASGATPGAGS